MQQLVDAYFLLFGKVLVNSYGWVSHSSTTIQSQHIPEIFYCGKLTLMQTLLHWVKLKPALLFEIPQTVWDLMIKWLIHHSTNNLYQNLFREILTLFIQNSTRQTHLQMIFIKLNLISDISQQLMAVFPNKLQIKELSMQTFCLTCKLILLELQRKILQVPFLPYLPKHPLIYLDVKIYLQTSSSWQHLAE